MRSRPINRWRSLAGHLLALVLTLASTGVWGQVTARPSARQAAPDTDPDVATIYRGVLGEQRVQLTLFASADDPRAFTGEYFLFGGGRNLQLAGEIDEENFYLDESEDGNRISADWRGKLVIEANRAYIVGTWRSAADKHTQSFKLERVVRTRFFVKRAV